MIDYVSEYLPEAKFKTRHDKTQLAVKNGIADLIGRHAKGGAKLLEIGGYNGWQTIAYRNRMNKDGSAEIYDWQDFRAPSLRPHIGFHQVNLETDRFPAGDESFDVIIINQVLEHLKNIYLPLSEILRILKIGGHLVVSVPNVCALHNLALLMLGRQPTTLAIEGSHVRAYAIWSMSHFLQRNRHLALVELIGYGLHPFTSASLPGFLRTYCHTPVWIMVRQRSAEPNWEERRQNTFTTTNF